VPANSPLGSVEGVFNGVSIDGDAVGTVMLEGRGAGAGPTASAVVADLVDIARGCVVPAFGLPVANLIKRPTRSMDDHTGAYYVRLMVVDRPGVFADVAAVLRDHQVSMESVLQRSRAPGDGVPLVLTTHDTRESDMRHALEMIGSLDSVVEAPRVIRVEPA
jgi:homoserine dehydrogenase